MLASGRAVVRSLSFSKSKRKSRVLEDHRTVLIQKVRSCSGSAYFHPGSTVPVRLCACRHVTDGRRSTRGDQPAVVSWACRRRFGRRRVTGLGCCERSGCRCGDKWSCGGGCDPHMAQRAIALALGSTTSSGRCEPVRLTLARLVKADLDSPKGVDVDFGSEITDMRAAAPDRESISCYGVAQSL